MTKSDHPSKPNPALEPLQVLIGAWDAEVDGTTWRETFEWLDDSFIIWRGESQGDFPASTSIIGRNESLDTYTMLYYDSRGVSRVYEMSFGDGVLKLWREDPGFYQRFEGKLSAEGTTIKGFWETAADGVQWKHDFDITYGRLQS